MADSGGVFVGGAWHEGDKMGYKTHDGIWHEIDKGYYKTFDGVWHECYSSGLVVSQLSIGSKVNVYSNRNGWTKYIAIQHNYNGTGRTLLTGERVYTDSDSFDSSSTWYEGSTIDRIFNTPGRPFYDDLKQSNIGKYIASVPIDSNGAKLNREIFPLSTTELNTGATGEGNPIQYFQSDASRIAYSRDGTTSTDYWTRTRYSSSAVMYINQIGSTARRSLPNYGTGMRIAFTVPATMPLNPQINANGAYDIL